MNAKKGKKNIDDSANAKQSLDSVLISAIKEILITSPDNRLPLEALANSLTKKIGHKVYKEALKGRGNFSKLMTALIATTDELTLGGSESGDDCGGVLTESMGVGGGLKYVFYKKSASMSVVSSAQDNGTDTNDDKDNDNANSNGKDNDKDKDKDNDNNDENDKDNDDNDDTSKREDIIALLSSVQVASAFQPLAHMDFFVGDIFDKTIYDWTREGDVVYCASLLFTDDMMTKITCMVEHMKEGAFFITLRPLCLSTPPPPDSRIEFRCSSFYRMSWQMAMVYVYQIKSN